MVRASVMFQVILGEWSLLRRPSVCLLQRRVGIFNGLYFQDQRVQDHDWYFFSKFQTSMGLDWESSAKYDRLSRGRTWWHTKGALLNTGTEWNGTEYTGISRNKPERAGMTAEWNGMDKNGTGTSRNDTGIYWNEPEWECNQHEYGQLNLKRAN